MAPVNPSTSLLKPTQNLSSESGRGHDTPAATAFEAKFLHRLGSRAEFSSHLPFSSLSSPARARLFFLSLPSLSFITSVNSFPNFPTYFLHPLSDEARVQTQQIQSKGVCVAFPRSQGLSFQEDQETLYKLVIMKSRVLFLKHMGSISTKALCLDVEIPSVGVPRLNQQVFTILLTHD